MIKITEVSKFFMKVGEGMMVWIWIIKDKIDILRERTLDMEVLSMEKFFDCFKF